MASLRKLKGNYYIRVRIPRDNNPPRDKLISTGTKYKREALIYLNEVNLNEELVRDGQNIEWSWKNGGNKTRLKSYSFKDALYEYLETRKADGLRNSTLDIYENALNYFGKAIKSNSRVDLIETDHINKFKKKYADGWSPTTMNMYLRGIKTFLKWLLVNEKITKLPLVKMVENDEDEPIYLPNRDFEKLLEASDLFTQRKFIFYRETGCRMSEPYYGYIDEEFLIVKSENSKGKRKRYIFLTDELKAIYYEMLNEFDQFKGKGKKDIIKRLTSKRFTRARKDADLRSEYHLHCLRHTFAVRRYLMTHDIYDVLRKLGHSTVDTTLKYTKFDDRKLAQDFPDLVDPKNGKKSLIGITNGGYRPDPKGVFHSVIS